MHKNHHQKRAFLVFASREFIFPGRNSKPAGNVFYKVLLFLLCHCDSYRYPDVSDSVYVSHKHTHTRTHAHTHTHTLPIQIMQLLHIKAFMKENSECILHFCSDPTNSKFFLKNQKVTKLQQESLTIF